MTDPYRERRERVLASLGDACLVLPSAPVHLRNNDVEHEYRQDSDFYYLTGFDEPSSVLVLRAEAPRVVLFVRPRDPERETWDGLRAGVDGAKALGADEAFPISELAAELPKLLENSSRLYYRLGHDRGFDDRVLAALDVVRGRAKLGKWWPVQIVEPATLVHEMRSIKSEHELGLLRRAMEISAEAHLAAMAKTRPGCYEYEIEALLRSIFRKHGAERPAYEPIVGSGPNATILHHRKNDRRMNDGEVLLIDAGCEYGYYAADITRTFPVSGRFSPAQRELYEVVLEAQRASIAATRPGATLDDVHAASVRVLTDGMVRLGLLAEPASEAIEKQTYKRYYMHRTSHWLGMDVHDVGPYFDRGKARPLCAGQVLTIEPGLYVRADDGDAPAQFRGIGIRIEDDVLVTADGCEVLSEAVPKTVADIERATAS